MSDCEVCCYFMLFFFSSRRRHTRCALVTGVQTCALPIYQRVDFNVDGIPHALVLSGRAEADLPRLAHDLTRICHVERGMFGQQPKLDQYLFLTNVVEIGRAACRERVCQYV